MKIVIVTGGTGGHIYPALSLADKFDKKNVLFIGSNNRMETKLIPEKGYEFYGIKAIGTNGNLFKKFKSVFLMFTSFIESIKVLKNYKPDIVVGFGNYISVPVIMAGKVLKIKTMIHEQNSIMGKANKFLSKFVDGIALSYDIEDKSNKTRFIGNPRSSIKESDDRKYLESLGIDFNKELVLIIMGSLGSSSINEILLKMCEKTDNINYNIMIVTGKSSISNFNKNYKNIIIKSYIDAIKVMKYSSLIVSRAGATSIAEITALKKPSILIPSPYVPNNHQYINAKVLKDKNATILIEEKDLNEDILFEKINMILNDKKLRNEMSKNTFKIAKIDSCDKMVEWIKEIV